ncbi:hypothetical protein AWJ20_51 [Sugiyamaella lignohabitans]|uniref:Uncharacterized protein n=1 Tax=Sugiyamaella lignohabitans TaxID=796027 RepID=A0A161HHU1_9ASCO|nr:uncharacterized protein AWJ20_51 [Sugiyamaella lignohabitans]ANB11827.1 hypothetical protein AWJ20_51 [Sugiyamaella lignohabitans]
MSQESDEAKIVHLYKSARALALSPISQAIQLRCFQTSSSKSINLPENAYHQQACPQCCIPWVPGLTVKIRIKLGNSMRTSGGLSKRARKRRQLLLQKKFSNSPPQLERKRALVYDCLVCDNRLVSDLSNKITVRDTGSAENISSVRDIKMELANNTSPLEVVASSALETNSISSAKKRAKERKSKSSLKSLLAKNRDKASTSSTTKLGLSDFFKPG